MPTKIEWAEESWNPVTGCTKVSPGCQNCYAERMAMRFTGHFNVTCHPDRLDQPLHWRKPRRIFVCSMGDLFHEDVPSIIHKNYSFVDHVFGIMALCIQHNFLILTKRPERMADYCNQWEEGMGRTIPIPDGQPNDFLQPWPLPNVWLGVTAENQEQADKRIPILLQIPATKRFVSMEPMLGGVDIVPYTGGRTYKCSCGFHDTEMELIFSGGDNYYCQRCDEKCEIYPSINWVVIGAESGPKRRHCEIELVRDVLGNCVITKTPVFVKQLHTDGKLSKNMDEWPEDLRVREYPHD